MGVYIDMEMPPDGRYTLCITHDSNGCVHWVFQNQDTLEFLKHGAVTEVNEPHGRLIDADAVTLKDGPYEYDDWCKWALRQYQGAPTVIQASAEVST